MEAARRSQMQAIVRPSTAAGEQSYDPWAHASRLGIQVFVRPLRSAHGLWFPDYEEILLGDHLRPWEQRCVLAHEVGHAVSGHRESSPRNEWVADRFAGMHLVTPKLLRAAVDRHGSDVKAIKADLGVTTSVLRAAFTPFSPPLNVR